MVILFQPTSAMPNGLPLTQVPNPFTERKTPHVRLHIAQKEMRVTTIGRLRNLVIYTIGTLQLTHAACVQVDGICPRIMNGLL